MSRPPLSAAEVRLYLALQRRLIPTPRMVRVTLRELADEFGLPDHKPVWEQMEALIEKGYVRRTDRQSEIELLEETPCTKREPQPQRHLAGAGQTFPPYRPPTDQERASRSLSTGPSGSSDGRSTEPSPPSESS